MLFPDWHFPLWNYSIFRCCYFSTHLRTPFEAQTKRNRMKRSFFRLSQAMIVYCVPGSRFLLFNIGLSCNGCLRTVEWWKHGFKFVGRCRCLILAICQILWEQKCFSISMLNFTNFENCSSALSRTRVDQGPVTFGSLFSCLIEFNVTTRF